MAITVTKPILLLFHLTKKENQKMEFIFVLRYAFCCNLITNDHVYKNLEAGTMFGSIVLSINLK